MPYRESRQSLGARRVVFGPFRIRWAQFALALVLGTREDIELRLGAVRNVFFDTGHLVLSMADDSTVRLPWGTLRDDDVQARALSDLRAALRTSETPPGVPANQRG